MTNKCPPLFLPHPLTLASLEDIFKPTSTRSWSRDVKNQYNQTCLVTGLKSSQVQIVAHHLYSRKKYPTLSASLYNGIVLENEVHKELHRKYGLSVTPTQFINFLKFYKINGDTKWK